MWSILEYFSGEIAASDIRIAPRKILRDAPLLLFLEPESGA
jgi:hypothetical protein